MSDKSFPPAGGPGRPKDPAKRLAILEAAKRLFMQNGYDGKNLVMKRGRPRARGRFGKIMKPFSEITIKVRQKGETA